MTNVKLDDTVCNSKMPYQGQLFRYIEPHTSLTEVENPQNPWASHIKLESHIVRLPREKRVLDKDRRDT